jgi:eukaryotic-like serine/threonine-protein kinase
MTPELFTSQLDRFEIRCRLGEGAFGVVYDAWDREHGRRVALKRLRSLASGALRRFKREFRVFADIVHPNVVRLGELMTVGSDWFFTMELVDGVGILDYVWDADTLAQPPDRGSLRYRSRFDEPRLRGAFAQLAAGVGALHERGLLHRDLKPSNVLVTREGRVVVLDFGLGQQLEGSRSVQSVQLAGTPAYMSPEQCDGRALSASSDWYSFGIMLYEALTGEPPFHGSMIQLMAQRLAGEPPAPRKQAPAVPADLDALCRDLLRTDPAARPAGAEIARRLHEPAAAVPTAATAQAAADDVFIGRAAQLAELHAAVAHVRRGDTALVFIEGESGMGKTALARQFLKQLRTTDDRALVLAGRCYARESVPFKAFDTIVDALSRYLDGLTPEQATPLLPDDWPALERLFPVLRDLGSLIWTGPSIDSPNAHELQQRGFAALRELLRRVATRHTLVLFIDDLQWGDVDSGNLLRELLRPPQPPPLLLVTSYRREDTTASPLLRMMRETRNVGRRWNIAIDALSAEETRALALARIGPDSPDAAQRTEALIRESLGSPFFIDELARYQPVGSLAAPTQLRLESVIEARLATLPEPARALLEVIAVAGRPIELRVANQAAGLDPRAAGTAELLYAEKWVRRRPGTEPPVLEPYHDRLRETIVSLLPGERLSSYHNRLAAALLGSGVADAETLAEHYRSAGELELAGRHALRAADQAADALAFDRAARLYQHSLELWQREDPAQKRAVLIRLAHALVNSGRGADAARQFLFAAQLANADESFDLTRAAAEQLLLSGHIDEGLGVLRRVLRAVGLRPARTPQHTLASVVGHRVLLWLRGLRWRPRRASEVKPALLRKVDVCASVAIGLGMIDIMQRQRFQAINLLLSLKAGEPSRVARALMIEMAITSAGGVRTRRRTTRLQEMSRALVEETDQPYTRGFYAIMTGIVAYLNDDYANTVELSREGERILREHCTGVTWELDTACVFELLALLHLGRWQEFASLAPTRFEKARERADVYLMSFFRARVNFLLHLLADDVERAREEQRISLFSWSRSSYQLQHYWAWHASCEIELYSGNAGGAWQQVRSGWRPFQLSLLPLMTQSIRVESTFLRARAALAAAAAAPTRERRALIRSAERDARRLAREKVDTARALATFVRAGVAAVRGDAGAALSHSREADAAFTHIGAMHYAMAARWHAGRLADDAAGAQAQRSAAEWMAAQGARAPHKLLTLLTPGASG